MNRRQISYHFIYMEKCNMCGSPISEHKIIGKRLNQSQGKNPSNKIGITTTVAKCSNCSLVYSNPQPIPFDIQYHYGKAPETYWQPEYFIIEDSYFKYEINKLNNLIDFKEGAKSLDIGAGIGKAMIALSKNGFDAYGFEPSKPFFEMAINKMGISPDRLKLGMIENLDYPENSFDFISFGAVLEHLYDPSASICKALKWLKPNGIIHIEVPSSKWLINKIVNFLYKLKRTDYVSNISPMHPPYHLHEFGLKSFQEHGAKYNYEIANHEYYVCQTYMPAFADYLLKPYMKQTNTGMQLCIWLRKK